MLAAALMMCALVAIDGDTLRCGGERIRLVGIDAPELSHCRQGRVCVAGDPVRSKEVLASRLKGRAQILRLGRDRYGRTIAAVAVNGVDLSCYQLSQNAAEYVKRWDNQQTVARRCPRYAR